MTGVNLFSGLYCRLHTLTTIITNSSVERLGLQKGRLIAAKVKAPWIILQGSGAEPCCSAENRLKGVVGKITRGRINSECVVRISPTTEVCAVVSSGSRNLPLNEGDKIWGLFSGSSVVLHVEQGTLNLQLYIFRYKLLHLPVWLQQQFHSVSTFSPITFQYRIHFCA